MNKAELISAVSGATALTKAQAGEVINAALQAMQEALTKGDDVRIGGCVGARVGKDRRLRGEISR